MSLLPYIEHSSLYEDIIEEGTRLLADFAIGFELEGYCKEKGFKKGDIPEYHTEGIAKGKVKELFNSLNKFWEGSNIIGSGKIEMDNTLSKPESKGDWAFEYASPIIPVNVNNMSRIIKLFTSLPKLGVYTNDTCGLHFHISFPEISNENNAWVMFSIANDQKLLNNILHLNDIKLFDERYASLEIIRDFKELGKELKAGNDIEDIRLKNNDTKYFIFHPHQQGTIEWRGPRGFLNNNNIETIHMFISKLYNLLVKINTIISQKEYNGFTKEEVIKHINISGAFETNNQKKKIAIIDSFLRRFKEDPNIIERMNYRKLKLLAMDNFTVETIFNILCDESSDKNVCRFVESLTNDNVRIFFDKKYMEEMRFDFSRRIPKNAIILQSVLKYMIRLAVYADAPLEDYICLFNFITNPSKQLIDFVRNLIEENEELEDLVGDFLRKHSKK